MKSEKGILINFKKAQSHMGRIIKMEEQGSYCIDTMQQNLAVIGILKSANQMLLERHLNSCFMSAMNSKNSKKKQEMVNEILKVCKMSK